MTALIRDVLLTFIGIAGFTLARYIWRTKRVGQPLVCPLRTRCELVTHSTYSKILGIPVEALGMLYYAFVAVFHAGAILRPEIVSPLAAHVSLGVSAAAFLFSMYLISIQAFVLRQWCTWCLISASFCVLIFGVTFFGTTGVL